MKKRVNGSNSRSKTVLSKKKKVLSKKPSKIKQNSKKTVKTTLKAKVAVKKAKVVKKVVKTKVKKGRVTRSLPVKSKKVKSKPKVKKVSTTRKKSKTFGGMINYLEQEIHHEESLMFKKHVGKYTVPIGIKLITFYVGFLVLLYGISFMSSVLYPTAIVFGLSVTGVLAILTNLIVLTILASIFYGLQKRSAYTLDLAITFFVFAAINSIISLFTLNSYSVFGNFMFFLAISSIFVNLVIIFYLWSEKKYFYARSYNERPWTNKDKIFVYVIGTFWILTLLIGSTYAIDFYKDTTSIVDGIVLELETTHPFFASEVCEGKQGKEKDVCMLVLATMQDSTSVKSVENICSEIDSQFYRFTCLRTLR